MIKEKINAKCGVTDDVNVDDDFEQNYEDDSIEYVSNAVTTLTNDGFEGKSQSEQQKKVKIQVKESEKKKRIRKQ